MRSNAIAQEEARFEAEERRAERAGRVKAEVQGRCVPLPPPTCRVRLLRSWVPSARGYGTV